LLDSAEEIPLLVDTADTDIAYGSEGKYTAKGYGTKMLRSKFIADPTDFADMVHVIAALALCISSHLDGRLQQSPCRDDRNIKSAIDFLFDYVELDEVYVQQYFAQYSGKPI